MSTLRVEWAACWGEQGHRQGVLATVGLDPNEIHLNLCRIFTKFVQIHTNSCKFTPTATIQECLVLPLLVFGHHLAVAGPFGVGLSLDDVE